MAAALSYYLASWKVRQLWLHRMRNLLLPQSSSWTLSLNNITSNSTTTLYIDDFGAKGNAVADDTEVCFRKRNSLIINWPLSPLGCLPCITRLGSLGAISTGAMI